MSRAAAFAADAEDGETVRDHAEVVLAGDRVAEVGQFFAVEFDQLLAHLAVEMIVLRVAVVVLVYRAAIERHFAQQARFDQFIERAIDSGPTNRTDFWFAVQAGDQLVGVEVVVPFEDVVHQHAALLRDPFAAALEVLFEPLLWRERDLNFTQ